MTVRWTLLIAGLGFGIAALYLLIKGYSNYALGFVLLAAVLAYHEKLLKYIKF